MTLESIASSAIPVAIEKSIKYLSDKFVSDCQSILKDKQKSDVCREAIKNYLLTQTQKFSYTKTFLKRDTPEYFYNVYYPLKVSGLSVEKLPSVFERHKCITLIGGAGCGKTTLVKHLFLRALKEKALIPIFVELRNLQYSKNTLSEYIMEQITSNEIDRNLIQNALKSTQLVIFFDGFDEISGDRKNEIIRDMEVFIDHNSHNRYLITARPYSDAESLSYFSNHRILPLDEDDIYKFVDLQLNNNLELAETIKSAVKKNIKSHVNSFFENPLFLSIFILTFQNSSTPPNEKSVFYQRIVNALFVEHDARKPGFNRHFRANLSQDQCVKILMPLSLVLYFKSMFSFDSVIIKNELNRVRTVLDLEFSSDLFIHDMVSAVSLWTEDSGMFCFSHRSLQEYFTATYLKELRGSSEKERIYRKLIDNNIANQGNFETSNLLSLCLEIDPISYYEFYKIPISKIVLADLKSHSQIAVVSLLYDGFDISVKANESYTIESIKVAARGAQKERFSALIELESFSSLTDYVATELEEVIKNRGNCLFENEESWNWYRKANIYFHTSKLESFLEYINTRDLAELVDNLLKDHEEFIFQKTNQIPEWKLVENSIINLI
jgi:predicted NACHT family NTPase